MLFRSFNTICATPRVIVEHCIGTLKGRFPFLRNICICITEDVETIKKVHRYIKCCILLHNLLIGWNDKQFDYEDEEEDDVTDGIVVTTPNERESNDATRGGRRREELNQYLRRRDVYNVYIVNK